MAKRKLSRNKAAIYARQRYAKLKQITLQPTVAPKKKQSPPVVKDIRMAIGTLYVGEGSQQSIDQAIYILNSVIELLNNQAEDAGDL